MWIQLNLGYVNYLSIANEKNDNIKNVEKVPIEVEKVPIETEKMDYISICERKREDYVK